MAVAVKTQPLLLPFPEEPSSPGLRTDVANPLPGAEPDTLSHQPTSHFAMSDITGEKTGAFHPDRKAWVWAALGAVVAMGIGAAGLMTWKAFSSSPSELPVAGTPEEPAAVDPVRLAASPDEASDPRDAEEEPALETLPIRKKQPALSQAQKDILLRQIVKIEKDEQPCAPGANPGLTRICSELKDLEEEVNAASADDSERLNAVINKMSRRIQELKKKPPAAAPKKP
jgi:hypothetical protein